MNETKVRQMLHSFCQLKTHVKALNVVQATVDVQGVCLKKLIQIALKNMNTNTLLSKLRLEPQLSDNFGKNVQVNSLVVIVVGEKSDLK